MLKNKSVYSLFLFTFFIFKGVFSQTYVHFQEQGDSSYISGNYKSALVYLNKSLSINPSYMKALNTRAYVYSALGKNNEAIRDFTKVIESKETSSIRAVARNKRAYLYVEEGKFKEGIEDFTSYLDWTENFDSRHQRGYAYECLGDYPKALSDYNALIGSEESDAYKLDVYYSRAHCYYTIDSINDAMNDVKKGISLNPYDARFYSIRWHIHFDAGDIETAWNDLKELKLADSSFEYLDQLTGRTYAKDGKHLLAVDAFSRQLTKLPDHANTYLQRGLSYMQLKTYAKAIKDLDIYVSKNPSSNAYNSRGWAYIEMKNYKQALRDLNKSILLDKNNNDAYDSRGCAKYYLGDFSGAIADFSQAISVNPEYGNSYFYRGKCQIKLKNTQKACSDLNTAFRLKNYTVFEGENTCEELLNQHCTK